MTTIKVLIGVAGSGKSTYISRNAKTKDLILSSDAIRKELYGDLHQIDHKKVFSIMENRLMDGISKGVDTIWYDATNINRKLRKHLYNTIYRKNKNKNLTVEAICFFAALPTILKQNAQRSGLARVPEDVIKRMYFNLEIPRLGIDCDKILMAYPNNDMFAEDKTYHYDENHYSPFHSESITQHIKWCIENAESTFDKDLIEIATYHDNGKYIVQTEVENPDEANQLVIDKYGKHCQYMQHENVGAMYYMALKWSDNDDYNKYVMMIAECIYHHMRAHGGITEKTIHKHKLTSRELKLLDAFKYIDGMSRTVDDELLENYKKLKELKKFRK